ncbi:hypothetical protein SteCoe_28180 [Stentor coeruleus]|uniref:Uncharacterized protein n=1 Tax=Stentor coeruleus TaxID=5963 RepID=A0A1R2B8T3_9CILI|nr:hypothetical protein SteCoe_28180 [Stentor coeruleus]
MDSFLFQVKSFMPEVHFYIMWFALLCSTSCLMKDSFCSFFKPNYVKLSIFVLLLFAGFTWTHDVTEMKNTEDFSNIEDKLELMTRKHNYSKLQRDVYMEGLEVFCLLLLLIVPRFHDYYIQTIKSYDRALKQASKASS